MKSRVENFKAYLTFLIINKIRDDLPSISFDRNHLRIPSNILLADPDFNKSSEIDMLLGAEIFFELLCNESIRMSLDQLIFQKTKLGWVPTGAFYPIGNQTRKLVCNLATKILQDSIEHFWKVEELSSPTLKSLEEQECENLFNETTKRHKDERFVVELPLRNDCKSLGSSLENAIKRLNGIERKFRKNPDFKSKYESFMSEYLSLGHMSEIDSSSWRSSSPVFYLPYHGVLKEFSLTTKLRMVFDGLCVSSTSVSINNLLKVGPAIQGDLLAILLRFRKYNVVLTADIEEMYRQVWVAEHHRDLQRIVWRSNENSKIKHYRLNTITYGTSSAAYLAVRSLHQIAIENRDVYSHLASISENDFCVDDLITGTESVEHAVLVKNQIIHLLNHYGVPLRKWVSNRVEILEGDAFNHSNEYLIAQDETNRTLGLSWQPDQDHFLFKINNIHFPVKSITKLVILSFIFKLFDPLGFLAPMIVKFKIFMQQLWQLKVGWDDELPIAISNIWIELLQSFQLLDDIVIPRQVVLSSSERLELHGFSDASLKAYSACIYIKSINESGTTAVRLLISKTKLAPLKTISVPRLELCGALLLSQLLNKTRESLRTNIIHRIVLWTDSTIVLSWLTQSPNTLKIFVANRVSEIQKLTSEVEWRHVPSDHNPADITSRGTNASYLLNPSTWWNGPAWLSGPQEGWPVLREITTTHLERRQREISLIVMRNDLDIFSKYSSLSKLHRAISYIFRFYYKCRKVTSIGNKFLTISELDNAFITLIKLSQIDTFSVEMNSLNALKPLPSSSRLKSLDPFMDSNGLLRVGGRLSNSNLGYDAKHPYILDPHHKFTYLIIINEHHRHLHAGIQFILASTRQRFWILRGRSTIRNILSKCVTCFRYNPNPIIQKMSDLPPDRVVPQRPFYVSGFDFAGPFTIKVGKCRNRMLLKEYLCVFVCFTTKAVHLELVNDLSTRLFLNALKRFVSRRGICARMYSDRGTNFAGADNELKEIYITLETFIQNQEIVKWVLDNKIDWKFNPPCSPHRGGLWEAAVRQAKYHLKRVAGTLTMTFEDFYTLVTQIEAIMNSRPLFPPSSDPFDISAITPGHFLIEQPLISLPQRDITHLPDNRLKQFEIIQQTVQRFWKSWNRDYLNHLHQRSRWNQPNQLPLAKRWLVLLMEDIHPPMYLRLGRVVDLHPGSDGLIRTVTLRTHTGLTTRAIQRLCLLPLENV